MSALSRVSTMPAHTTSYSCRSLSSTTFRFSSTSALSVGNMRQYSKKPHSSSPTRMPDRARLSLSRSP